MQRRRFLGTLAGAVAALALQLDPPRREKSVRDRLGEWLGRKKQDDMIFAGQFTGWEGTVIYEWGKLHGPGVSGESRLVGREERYSWPPQSSDASLPAA